MLNNNRRKFKLSNGIITGELTDAEFEKQYDDYLTTQAWLVEKEALELRLASFIADGDIGVKKDCSDIAAVAGGVKEDFSRSNGDPLRLASLFVNLDDISSNISGEIMYLNKSMSDSKKQIFVQSLEEFREWAKENLCCI